MKALDQDNDQGSYELCDEDKDEEVPIDDKQRYEKKKSEVYEQIVQLNKEVDIGNYIIEKNQKSYKIKAYNKINQP